MKIKTLLLGVSILLIALPNYGNSKAVLALAGPCIIFTELNKSFAELGATARDSVGVDISSSIIIKGQVDITKEGKYYLVYDVPDSIAIVDSIVRIVIVGSVSMPNFSTTDTVECPVFTSTDTVNGFVNYFTKVYGLNVTKSGLVNYNVLGLYHVVLTIGDSASLNCSTNIELVIKVVDHIKPVIQVNGGDTIT